MTKLIYITHPSVEIVPNIRIDTWQLSEEGQKAAKRLSKLNFYKNVRLVYSSREPKAIETAQILSEKYHFKIKSYKELNELNRSSTGFILPDEYIKAIQYVYQYPDRSFQGWEKLDKSYERNTEVLQEIIKKHVGDLIIIIGHGQSGTLIKCWIKKIKPSWAEDPKTTACYFIADLNTNKILQDWTKY